MKAKRQPQQKTREHVMMKGHHMQIYPFVVVCKITLLTLGGMVGSVVYADADQYDPAANGQNGTHANCPMIEHARILFRSSDEEDKDLAEKLAETWARTDAGHHLLQEMLKSSDVHDVRLAAVSIWSACDFKDIFLLTEAAIAHEKDKTVYDYYFWSLRNLFPALSAGIPEELRGKNPSSLRQLAKWLSDHQNLWADRTFADYWGEQLILTIKLLRANNPSLEESLGYFAGTQLVLIQTDDVKNAVPAVMKALGILNPDEDDPWIYGMTVDNSIGVLQAYVGPIDIISPRTDIIEFTKKHEALLAWWGQNSDKSPAQWILFFLAQRDVAIDITKPGEVVAWLDKTLRQGTVKDQYVASLLLEHAFPRMAEVPLPNGNFFLLGEDELEPQVWNYLVNCRLAQTSYWAMFSHVLRWDDDRGVYVLIREKQ